jgi:hypothetical protein
VTIIYRKINVLTAFPFSAMENWYDYLNYDGYYQPFNMDNDRTKRSAKAEQPLTAENMMADAPQRSKRDLKDDELNEWLEEEVGLMPEDYEEVMEEEPNEDIVERLMEGAEIGEWAPEPVDVDEEEYYADVEPSVDDEAKLALLRYIYEKLPESMPEQQYEVPYDIDTPSYEELLEQDELEYEPIVYRGVPGVFIPLQPQGPIPDVRKRGSDFFPYNYESSPSGRWGAFLPSHNEQKRNAEAYERLYQMARALRRYDDDWL